MLFLAAYDVPSGAQHAAVSSTCFCDRSSELIAGEGLHLKILSFRRCSRLIKSAVCNYSENGEKKESGADNWADRDLHKKEGGEANENCCSLAGEKFA
jgi:hypothetical protein